MSTPVHCVYIEGGHKTTSLTCVVEPHSMIGIALQRHHARSRKRTLRWKGSSLLGVQHGTNGACEFACA